MPGAVNSRPNAEEPAGASMNGSASSRAKKRVALLEREHIVGMLAGIESAK